MWYLSTQFSDGFGSYKFMFGFNDLKDFFPT